MEITEFFYISLLLKDCLDIQSGPKTLFCTPELHQVLTDFQTYFTVRIRRTFVIIQSLKVPRYLKCVSTLPCEMAVS